MKRSLACLLFVLFLASNTYAQPEAARIKNYNIKNSLGIEGYDPVSYFSNEPMEGKSENKFAHKGVSYWFANKTNLNKFKTDPDKYEPAYGGWCAYAMGDSGEKVKVDPETFKIVDGKLFLFYNFWGNNTLTDWNKNEKVLKSKADQNWRKFIQ